MRVAVDLYVRRQSWLHATDPRVKLLAVAVGLVILLAFKNLYVMLTVLIGLHVVHWSASIPREKILFVWRTLLPISIMIATLWIVFYPSGTPILEFWLIKVTPLSVAQGLALALRINAMALLVFAWLYTTDNNELVLSLVKLRLPYSWGLVLSLALRYIPTFQATYGMISDAQQARGLRISEESGFKRVRVMMPIFVAMVISALRTSEDLAKALEARGFGLVGTHRTFFRDLDFRGLDWLFTGTLLLAAAVMIYLNLSYSFGQHVLRLFP